MLFALLDVLCWTETENKELLLLFFGNERKWDGYLYFYCLCDLFHVQ